MEHKRELFKRYLDEKKVMTELSRIVVSMYECPEHPSDPLQYIKDYLAHENTVDLYTLRRENEELDKRLKDLRKQINTLQKRQNKEEPSTS